MTFAWVFTCICKNMYICAMSMFRDVHMCNGNDMGVSYNVYTNFKLSTIIIIAIIT